MKKENQKNSQDEHIGQEICPLCLLEKPEKSQNKQQGSQNKISGAGFTENILFVVTDFHAYFLRVYLLGYIGFLLKTGYGIDHCVGLLPVATFKRSARL
ncbi:hypothetical protein SDC9_201452 [bioreactor metagenome]|uniref:Uncharacterized protein n=1 Tax=bioreactor metagenome TaxID=1076179 RepID=A0A645IRQ1_9ZZZZ